ncbi:MAG: acyl carrier protein [Prochlorotrichaceae cyanobacterium]|jgi:acyl carrier protein
MDQPSIISKLKTIIANELDVNLSVDEIDENTSLFEDGLGFDSIATVEMISLVEKHFDVQFADSELSPEYFGNLIILSKFILSKKEAQVGT